MPFDSVNIESERTRLLRQALSLVDRDGKWLRFESHTFDSYHGPRYCSTGAIHAVVRYPFGMHHELVECLWLALPSLCQNSEDTHRRDVQAHNDGLPDHSDLLAWWHRAIEMSVERDVAASSST